MRRLITLVLAVAFATPAVADPWAREPMPGAYTRWPLPAAGPSQSGAPEIILTFDDGPHEKYTPQILDELARRNLKAIFFWVGWRVAKDSPRRQARRALVERAVREGHIVANHTTDHEHLCRLRPADAAAQIDDTTAVYRELVGMPIAFFRAPYGDHCPRLVALLTERGLDHMHWDIDPMEWVDNDGVRVAGTLRRKITRVGKYSRRAVILMHDTRKASAVALPRALSWLDRENRRRRDQGMAEIRVLDGSDLAEELMDSGLRGWARDAANAAADRLVDGLSRVVP